MTIRQINAKTFLGNIPPKPVRGSISYGHRTGSYVRGLDGIGCVYYYTGKAGEGFVSPDKAAAFTGYTIDGARRRAQNLNAMSGAHGITFIAVEG